MALQAIGAGLGRTGTYSLKFALERLLGGRCFHMVELLHDPSPIDGWMRALEQGSGDWEQLFAGYDATVDWIGASFYAELAAAYPEAPVILTVRDTDEWWRSVRETVIGRLLEDTDHSDPLEAALAPARRLSVRLLETRFTPEWSQEAACKRAYERHNAGVRAAIAAERLIEWRPGDGWAPLCAGLGVAVPAEPFPHLNTAASFRSGEF